MFDIIKILEGNLPKYKNILELGSKKGEDLEVLDGYYEVVASENEKIKTRFLKDKYLDIRVILVDIVEMDTHKKFECVYSKNLLDELSLEQIEKSFENQKKVLENESLVLHIFRENKVSFKNIEEIVSKNYDILESKCESGSFFILAKKKES